MVVYYCLIILWWQHLSRHLYLWFNVVDLLLLYFLNFNVISKHLLRAFHVKKWRSKNVNFDGFKTRTYASTDNTISNTKVINKLLVFKIHAVRMTKNYWYYSRHFHDSTSFWLVWFYNYCLYSLSCSFLWWSLLTF